MATATRAELFPTPDSAAWLELGRHVADLGWGLLGARARQDGDLAATVSGRITEDLVPPRS